MKFFVRLMMETRVSFTSFFDTTTIELFWPFQFHSLQTNVHHSLAFDFYTKTRGSYPVRWDSHDELRRIRFSLIVHTATKYFDMTSLYSETKWKQAIHYLHYHQKTCLLCRKGMACADLENMFRHVRTYIIYESLEVYFQHIQNQCETCHLLTTSCIEHVIKPDEFYSTILDQFYAFLARGYVPLADLIVNDLQNIIQEKFNTSHDV